MNRTANTANTGIRTSSAGSRFLAVCAALATVAALAAPASADGPEAEAAAAAVWTAVTQTYAAQSVRVGRAVETSCTGTTSFRCSWWIIKNRFDRKATKSDTALPVMSRKGEGVQHNKASRVKFSGSANVDWICVKRTKKGTCSDGAYSVSLK